MSGDFSVISFSDSVSAGFPSPAEGYEDEPLDLHRFLVRNPAATFFHRLKGEIHEEHLCQGAILVVDRSLTPSLGKLVLAEHANQFIVIRLNGQTASRYPDLRVCGVIVASVRRL